METVMREAILEIMEKEVREWEQFQKDAEGLGFDQSAAHCKAKAEVIRKLMRKIRAEVTV